MKFPITIVILAVAAPLCLAKSVDTSNIHEPEENEVLKGRSEPKRCCLPYETWTGNLRQVTGTVTNGDAQLIESDGTLYQDLPNHRMAVNQTIKTKYFSGNNRVVYDYTKGLMYNIVPAYKSCVKSPGLKAPNNNCVPDSAVYTGSLRLGSKSTPLMVDSWRFPYDLLGFTVQLDVTVTRDGCNPVSQVMYGRMNASSTDILISQVLSDMEEGVKDKTVFDLPDYCEADGTTGLGAEHLTPKLQVHNHHHPLTIVPWL